MYFLIDENKLTIFGWSAKCGCTHIKNIFYFLKYDKFVEENNHVSMHSIFKWSRLSNNILDNINKFTIIIFCRNPYKRIVSGFRDKYAHNGEIRYKWPDKKNIRFKKFVNQLGNWKYIDFHHFTPQTSEAFNFKITEGKIFKCFDIENIDYDFIEKLYNKKIPSQIINFKGEHVKQDLIKDEFKTKNIFDLNLDVYNSYKISYKYFYDEEIKEKVYDFYKNDFLLFSKYGIDYEI